MPTVTFSLKDLQKLAGKKFSMTELDTFLTAAKATLDQRTDDQLKIEFSDTNLPYLWSAEGFAVLIKGMLNKEKGIPKLKLNKANYSIKVDPSVKKIRPYISAFVAKNIKITDEFLIQLIQLQEKLADTYGRKRDKIAIGLYPVDKITFPLTYKAVRPETTSFTPLGNQREMHLRRILKEHPKGKEYAHTLDAHTKYPILCDANNDILSFIPIINSKHLGRVEEASSNIFFEATGTDQDAVHLVTNIFAQALHERSAAIYSVDVKYPKKVTTPYFFKEKRKLNPSLAQHLTGLDLSKTQQKQLLTKMRYDVVGDTVHIPHYRRDILHPADIIEDMAICYGFDHIEPQALSSFTVGSMLPINKFINNVRDLFIGQRFQEVFSQILSNKNTLYTKMGTKATGAVELEEYMSETYSVVRTALLPIMMDVLSKNKHVEYPHRIFEQGLVTKRATNLVDHEQLAAVVAHEKANFTEMKQVLDAVVSALNLSYTLDESNHPSFIKGRAGTIIIKKKNIGVIGEIAPPILDNYGLTVPVAALELNLTELYT